MYPGLRYEEKKTCMQKYFLESVCLGKKIRLAVEKKNKKILGQFQFYLCCRHQKKC